MPTHAHRYTQTRVFYCAFFPQLSTIVRHSTPVPTHSGWVGGWVTLARRIDRLTDKSVKAKKEKGYYADGDGLYLQVTETGAKSWIFRFKRDGKARDMGLGGYPAVSLAEARQKAKEPREHRDAGRDPIEER